MSLGVAKEVVSETVTVIAQLELVMIGRYAAIDLDSRIHVALKDIIEADWVLNTPEPFSNTRGIECVRLKAVAKVPAKESRYLQERAAKASREGV